MDDRKRILLEALITEREGIITENNQRIQLGQSVAYRGEAFFELEREIRGVSGR